MEYEVGKFQGFIIYRNDEGFYWANGGYYDVLTECQDDIKAFNQSNAEIHDDTPCLDAPWWAAR